MDLRYCYPGVDYSVESILEFVDDARSGFWSEPFFYVYPQIDRERFLRRDREGRRAFLRDFFAAFSRENEALIAQKLGAYNECWRSHRPQIVDALQDAFECSLEGWLDDMVGNVTFNPISPRDLSRHTFDVFYQNSEKGALGVSLHEVIHFAWFRVWKDLFQDSCAEYETPHLKWILSEMAVEPIMRDERLRSINPYFDDGCVYPYFYTLTIGGEPILSILHAMYKAMPIAEFMARGYALCQEHEAHIRRHIAENE